MTMRALLALLILAPLAAHAGTYGVLDGNNAVENVIVSDGAGTPVCAVPPCSLVPLANLSAQQLGPWATPAPTPATPEQIYALAVSKGIAIVSTSTPSLNGTYAIDGAAVQNISGVYSGIKDGDGLPGGGTSFNYPDASGAMHGFTATTFPPFARAVRDYLYALSQGQAPAQPVTIP